MVESLPDSRRLSSVLPRYPGILDKQEIGEIGCSWLHCTYEISHIQCPILEHTQSQVHNETCYCWQMLRELRPPWLCVQLLSNSGIWSSGQGHEHRKRTGSSSPKRLTRTESAVRWTNTNVIEEFTLIYNSGKDLAVRKLEGRAPIIGFLRWGVPDWNGPKRLAKEIGTAHSIPSVQCKNTSSLCYMHIGPVLAPSHCDYIMAITRTIAKPSWTISTAWSWTS